MTDYTQPNAPLGPTTNIRTANPKWVTNAALGLLEDDLVLAGMVFKDQGIDFAGSIGQAVNIKRPTRSMGSFDITPLQTNDFLRDGSGNISDPYRETRPDAVNRSGFVPDHIEETYIQVRLDTNRGSEHYISDEQLDWDIDQFAAEVLQPQTRGLAEYLEYRLAADIQTNFGPNTDATPDHSLERVVSVQTGALSGTDLTADAQAVRNAIIDARAAANAMRMPQNGRFLLTTPAVEAVLLKDPNFQRVDWSGTSQALREAVVGQLYGLTIVTSNELANHTQNGMVMYLWHPTSLILCTRAPAIPKGASFGSSASYNGIAMRWMMDYDPSKLQDRSFLNFYLGTTPVTEDARWIADRKARLPKLAPNVYVPASLDVMRCVRIDVNVAKFS